MSRTHTKPDGVIEESSPVTAPTIEARIVDIGECLLSTFGALLAALDPQTSGPQALARAIGIDKVVASRILKAMRCPDAVSAVHAMPGPEPLRRAVRGMKGAGVATELVEAATDAVDRFADLIRVQIGDRSSLDAIISSWIPEARREFELRRKQTLFRAISQLKGVEAKATVATVLLHPSEKPGMLDIVWLQGFVGVQRIRPGARIKLSTRRLAGGTGERHPLTLDRHQATCVEDLLIKSHCSSPPPELTTTEIDQTIHYCLSDGGFGPNHAVDALFGEANIAEMEATVPADDRRKAFVFAEVSLPSRVLHFDVLVHEDVYPGSEPQLAMYETALEGIASVNDRSRDIDRLDMVERIVQLGEDLSKCRSSDIPRYNELLVNAASRLGWDLSKFRGYRCRVHYPLYGTQVTMAFDPPSGTADGVS